MSDEESHVCQKAGELEIIKALLLETRVDVKKLLAFKWQMLGMAGSLSIIIFVGNFLLAFMRGHQ